MYIGRIIDVWQVILQEPRVAEKEALMLLQPELQQKLVRDELAHQARLVQKTVLKSYKAKEERRVTGEGERRKESRRPPLRYVPRAKHARAKEAPAAAVMPPAAHRIDITV